MPSSDEFDRIPDRWSQPKSESDAEEVLARRGLVNNAERALERFLLEDRDARAATPSRPGFRRKLGPGFGLGRFSRDTS